MNVSKKAQEVLPAQDLDLGDLVSIGGSLIDTVLAIYWYDYRKCAERTKDLTSFSQRKKQMQRLNPTPLIKGKFK